MLFKDMKQGYPVFFFDRENVKAYQGRVVSVAVPRYDAPHFGQVGTPNQGMVVDVTIEADGVSKTYTIPEGSSMAYASTLVLATDKSDILREVESVKASAEEALAKADKYKSDIEKCSGIIGEWDASQAERISQNKRIGEIESEVKSMRSDLQAILGKLDKVL